MRWARTRTAGGRAACCSSGSPAPCALLRNPIVSRHFGRRWPLGVGRTGREQPWRDARCRGDASRTAPHSWAPPHARRALWHNRPRVSMSLCTMWASPPGPGRTRPISRTPQLVNSVRLDQIDHGNTPVWPVSGTPNLISSSRDWDPHSGGFALQGRRPSPTGGCSAGQERPCRYPLGPIDHPEKTGRYQPALPYVCGVWCLCCAHYVHTPQLPRQGPKPAAGCTRAQLRAFPGRVWVQISARNRQNHPPDPN